MSAARGKMTAILLIGAGVLCLALGIWRGEMETIFVKAINICLECIGIG